MCIRDSIKVMEVEGNEAISPIRFKNKVNRVVSLNSNSDTMRNLMGNMSANKNNDGGASEKNSSLMLSKGPSYAESNNSQNADLVKKIEFQRFREAIEKLKKDINDMGEISKEAGFETVV